LILSNNDAHESRQNEVTKIDEKEDNSRSSDRNLPTTKSIMISSVLSHVFRRPYVSVSPETPLLELGTYLATGHQIYVDGLIVAQDKKLAGRIGGQHILDCLLKTTYDDWSTVKASDLMEENTSSLELDSSLNDLLELFAGTKFALAPISEKGELIGSIGIRDLLPLVFESKLPAQVTTVGSTQVLLKGDETLRTAIDTMLKKRIRNLVLSGNIKGSNTKTDYIINDRKILEFIFSYEGKKVMAGVIDSDAFSNIRVDSLDLISASHVSRTETVSRAANMLRDINTPAILSEDKIITPWDVVMKTIWKKD
jgi:predicted transcriptional regulator